MAPKWGWQGVRAWPASPEMLLQRTQRRISWFFSSRSSRFSWTQWLKGHPHVYVSELSPSPGRLPCAAGAPTRGRVAVMSSGHSPVNNLGSHSAPDFILLWSSAALVSTPEWSSTASRGLGQGAGPGPGHMSRWKSVDSAPSKLSEPQQQRSTLGSWAGRTRGDYHTQENEGVGGRARKGHTWQGQDARLAAALPCGSSGLLPTLLPTASSAGPPRPRGCWQVPTPIATHDLIQQKPQERPWPGWSGNSQRRRGQPPVWKQILSSQTTATQGVQEPSLFRELGTGRGLYWVEPLPFKFTATQNLRGDLTWK